MKNLIHCITGTVFSVAVTSIEYLHATSFALSRMSWNLFEFGDNIFQSPRQGLVLLCMYVGTNF
jgi:hypothetical protein